MIVLYATSQTTVDALKVTTGSATNVDVYVAFEDMAGTSSATSAGRASVAITTATTTTVVTAPTVKNARRAVKFIAIMNKDASASNTVTVTHSTNAIDVELVTVDLAAGNSLFFDEATGFATFPPAATGGGGGGDVPSTRTLTAGAGLTGGGTLAADRTFNVVANGDGSIVVNANDIQVGTLASDGQHGNLGGGSLHSAATGSVAGFMSAADKTKLTGIATGATKVTTGVSTVDFGAFPGADTATLVITDVNIGVSSVAHAWVAAVSTNDHSADEHMAEQITAYATNIIASSGFTIVAVSSGPGLLWGQWSIGWSWQ